MSLVKICFQTNNLPLSLLIRGIGNCQWSHVGLNVNGTVYESRCFSGVIKTAPHKFMERGKYAEVVIDLDSDSVDRLFEWCESQVGKKYDWAGVFSFPFRADWENEEKWYCSEFVAAAFRAIDKPVTRDGLTGVSVRDLWVQRYD